MSDEAHTPASAGTRRVARAMVGLDFLPLPAREAVVQLLRPADWPARRAGRRPKDALRTLPLVSAGTLAALQELRLPIGRMGTRRIDEAVQQAHATRRAWDLGTLNFHGDAELSVLTGCAALHTLKVTGCDHVANLSALPGCAALQTLDLTWCWRLTNVSPLAGCGTLHTLDLTNCIGMTDVSALAGCASLHTLNFKYCCRLRDISALAGCAALRTVKLHGCREVMDISALANCAGLHTLDISFSGVVDVSVLGGCAALHTLDLTSCRDWRTCRR